MPTLHQRLLTVCNRKIKCCRVQRAICIPPRSPDKDHYGVWRRPLTQMTPDLSLWFAGKPIHIPPVEARWDAAPQLISGAALMLCLRHVGGYWIGCTSAELDQRPRNELVGCGRDALLVMWRPLLDTDKRCKVSGWRMSIEEHRFLPGCVKMVNFKDNVSDRMYPFYCLEIKWIILSLQQ